MRDTPIHFVHISPVLPSFVLKDIGILSSEFPVKTLLYSGRSSVLPLARGIASSSISFCWFAWDQAAWAVRLSKWLGKNSIVVIGGFDVVSLPEIDYGNLLNKASARRTKYAILNATRPIAVSKSVRNDGISLTGCEDIEVVYHGFDSTVYGPGNKKEDLVLTVGEVNESNMLRKGLIQFLRAAESLPETRFAIVGRVAELSEKHESYLSLPNLEVTGYVSDEDLLHYMQRARVYVQVSAHEGFGCSLAEAMLCECVPVVTSRGALPEVVGDTGYFVPYDDVPATADAIKEALQEESLGRRARERIKDQFPLHRRREALLEIVRELV